jgi:hypothetical protein
MYSSVPYQFFSSRLMQCYYIYFLLYEGEDKVTKLLPVRARDKHQFHTLMKFCGESIAFLINSQGDCLKPICFSDCDLKNNSGFQGLIASYVESILM